MWGGGYVLELNNSQGNPQSLAPNVTVISRQFIAHLTLKQELFVVATPALPAQTG